MFNLFRADLWVLLMLEKGPIFLAPFHLNAFATSGRWDSIQVQLKGQMGNVLHFDR